MNSSTYSNEPGWNGKKLAIMQPYFFPYLGYFQLIHAADKFILYDNLNYIKYGWVNRNRIIINAAPFFIIVPVLSKSSFTKIRDIKIAEDTRWKPKLKKALYTNYRKSKYFGEVYPVIEGLLDVDTEYLAVLNSVAIKRITEFLEISTEIVPDSTPYDQLEKQLEQADPEIALLSAHGEESLDTKTIRALCICRNEKSHTMINPIGGQALYDKQVFKKNGIDLFFIHTLPYSYPQLAKEFVAGMSILDVLFHCGKTGTQRLLDEYELL